MEGKIRQLIKRTISELLAESYEINNHEKINNTDIYYFSSPKNKYIVKIMPYQGRDNYFSIGFGLINDDSMGYNSMSYDTSAIVNESPYEVMSTVAKISAEFARKNNIDGFIFSLTGDKEKNRQRLMLYKKAMNNFYPKAKLEYIEGIYHFTFNHDNSPQTPSTSP